MPNAVTLSDANITSIPLEWSNGLNIEQLARKYGVHTMEISDIVKAHFGGKLPQKKRKCRVFTAQEEGEMVDMYVNQKKSAKYIYTHFKATDYQFIDVLKKHGVEYVPLNFAHVDEATEKEIVRLYGEEKKTSHDIPKILGLPYQRVRKVLLRNGFLDGQPKQIHKRYSPEFRETVVQAYSDPNITVADVAKKVGLTYHKTRGILLRGGVSIRQLPSDISERISIVKKDEYEVVKERFLNGESMGKIAREMEVSSGVIMRVMKKLGLYEPKKFFQYHDNYFNQIDTHTKAYILGFLITDGYNSEESGFVSLTIHEKDTEILEKINRELSIDKPLRFIRGRKTPYACMTLHSPEMSLDIARFGIVQAKTFKIKAEDWMTGEFANSAILGMMDGDGSFYYRERWPKKRKRRTAEKSWTFSFIGLRCVCEMMQKTFKEKLCINSTVTPHTKYKNNLEKPICTVRVYGNRQNKILMDWLYKDCPIFMKRKHDNYLDMCEFIRTKRVNQFG